MAGVERAASDDHDGRGLRQPARGTAAPEWDDIGLHRRRGNLGQEALLHPRRYRNLGQRIENPPGLFVRGPFGDADRARFNVLMRQLALHRIERLGQQQRHVFSHGIAVKHRSPPRESPVSAFFSTSMARNTLVFTAPSEQPEICAISAYDSPW